MAKERTWLTIAARILVVLLVIFVILQFVRPPGNRREGTSPTAIDTRYSVPENVQSLLQRSCYDCHSDNTRYPWYSYVEPVGWFLNSDITEGKRELNFDEFTSYPIFRQFSRFRAIQQQIQDGEMPLPAYTLIHVTSILTPDEKDQILHWTQAMQDTLKARYPADSLRRPVRRQ